MRSFTSFFDALEWLRSNAAGDTSFRSRSPLSSPPGRIAIYCSYTFILCMDGDYSVELAEMGAAL